MTSEDKLKYFETELLSRPSQSDYVLTSEAYQTINKTHDIINCHRV